MAAAAILIALTWFGTLSAVRVEAGEANARVEGEVANQALLFEGEFRRELMLVDQTLQILEREWEADPTDFDLQLWRERALMLPDLSLHIFITDASGIIRTSTRRELIGVDVSGRDYFRYEEQLARDNGETFIGPATRGLVTDRWQMNMARRLDGPSDQFRGVIGASYDTTSLTRFYRQADLGDNGMLAIVGLRDGRLRALVGPPAEQPGLDLSGTPMMTALLADPNRRWTGPSSPDGVTRIHAFRVVPDRDLAVVLAFDAKSALLESRAFVDGARIFAAGTTLFILVVTGALLRNMWTARRRESVLRRDRATLAAANAELEAARRRADGKTAQLEAMLAGMSDGVSVLDPEMRLVAWNDLFAEFSGVPRDVLRVGMPGHEILRAQALAGEFGPVDVEAEVARRFAMVRAGQTVGTIERARPCGRTLELRRTALPGGGYVTLYNDITDRKQSEDAMRRAREMAEATTEAKSRFVATVSHEIRTPLNTLLNSLRLLGGTGLSGSQERLVDMALQAGDGLLGLINDILEMSKMEAGRLSLRPSLFALRPMLESVLGLFRDEAAVQGIGLSLATSETVPDLIHGDSGRIRQVLVNLVGNAVKFASPGPVLLLAELGAEQGRRMLRLTVRDPGPALSSADRARIFQPFSRLDRAHPETAPGTGLGLAICHGLALLMQGEIGCATSPDNGNDFWLAMPLDRAASEAVGGSRAPSVVTLPRTRILLVEDVLPNQLVTATLLRREGHMVDVASSGEAALRALSNAPYDIVFMDVFMPGMNGLDTTRHIRALLPPTASVPVVALTANVAAEDRARCLEAGMDDLVAKPVEIGWLTRVIARHVWPSRVTPEPDEPTSARVGPDPATRMLSDDRIAELRANLTRATLVDLARDCLDELRRRLVDLRAALADGEADAIGYETHAMAGLAASYGLAALDEQLRGIANSARTGAVARARAQAADLEAELDRAGPALLAALGEELVTG